MKIKVYWFFAMVVGFSCARSPTNTFNYSSLKYDSSTTAIFSWDSTLLNFLPYAEPIALCNEDLRLADSLFFDAVQKFNKTYPIKLYESFQRAVPIDSFTIDLSKYKRQYYPYSNVNGEKMFYVVCFSKPFPEWQNKKYHGYKLHGGMSEFSLKINLSSKTADDVSFIGGYG